MENIRQNTYICQLNKKQQTVLDYCYIAFWYKSNDHLRYVVNIMQYKISVFYCFNSHRYC